MPEGSFKENPADFLAPGKSHQAKSEISQEMGDELMEGLLVLGKYYIKSWAPPALHPRLFFFDKERNAKPDYDSAFAQTYLKWPPTIPPFEH